MSWLSVRIWIVMLICIYQQASLHAAEVVCSNNCAIVHPQQHFCNANAAFKAKVISSAYIDANHAEVHGMDSVYVRYEAEVLLPLKGAQGVQPGSTVYFYSPTSGFTCTISSLTPKGIYVIAGKVQDGMLIVTDCDGLAIKWSALSKTQKEGVKGKYQSDCDTCRINGARTVMYIGGEQADAGLESGFWSSSRCFFNPIPSVRYGGEDCETLYGVCAPDPTADPDIPCSWAATNEYLDCAERRESAWFLMEKAEPAYTCRSQCMSLPNQNLKFKCIRQIVKLERQGHPRC